MNTAGIKPAEICGSLRRGSNTAFSFERAMKGAQEVLDNRVDMTSCFLEAERFAPCQPCNRSAGVGHCRVDDDLEGVRGLWMAAGTVADSKGKRLQGTE